MGRKNPDLKRRGPVKEPKKTFYLFCEGRNTEPHYFRSLKRKYVDPLIQIVPEPAAGVPFTIAQKSVEKCNALGKGAKRKKVRQSYQKADEVWAIFDRDEHPRFEEAKKLCLDNNVNIAVSDPCFELWLVLHIQEFDRPCNRHEIQDVLQGLVKEYDKDKGKTAKFDQLLDQLDLAEKRAGIQFNKRIEEGGILNPSTNVFELTRKLRKNL